MCPRGHEREWWLQMKATYDKETHEKIGRPRRALVMACFVAAGAAIIIKAVYLQYFQSDTLTQESRIGQVRDFEIPAGRGDIVDRNGEVLALSIPAYAVVADPEVFDFSGKNIAALAAIVEKDEETVRTKLTKARAAGRRFVYLTRLSPPEKKNEVMHANLPGIRLKREYKRFYPLGEAAAQLIGYTDIDSKGLEGIERAYEETLYGHAGKRRAICDARGRQIKDLGEIKTARIGTRVRLSIDKRIQYRAWRAVKDAVEEHDARAGAMVILDARNGAILALANYPSFNPHDRKDMKPERVRNGSMLDAIEVGSVIKPFVVANLLEQGYVRVDTAVQTAPGYFMYKGNEVRDIKNYGHLDVTDILVKSSNVGISKLALRSSTEDLWMGLKRLGFGQSPLTGFPGETKGRLRHYSNWQEVDRVVLSYGYGMSASLLQLAHAYTALANDGVIPSLSLLANRDVVPAKYTRVFGSAVARNVKDMLTETVDRGTGVLARAHGYTTAGKTGTVHKNSGGGYHESAYRSLFAGFAPADRPRLVAAVMIDEPRGGKHLGGHVAAPVFSRVITAALRSLGVPENEFDDISPEHLTTGRKMLRKS